MLTRFDDFDRTYALMDQLRRRMDQFFDEVDQDPLVGEVERVWGSARFPRIQITDTGSSLLLKADVPGLTQKDVQLAIHQDVLTMNGERKSDVPEGYFVHRQERAPVKFSRSYSLPCKVDPEKSTATIKNGVLTIVLNKPPESQPRQIAVKAQ